MQFEEPGDEYSFDKIKKTSLKTKIRVTVLFFCFLGVIFVIAKNNFSFAFGLEEKVNFSCGPSNTHKASDDREYSFEKCQKAFKANEYFFQKLPGYIEGKVLELPIGYKKSIKPILRLFFNEESSEHKEIPDTICGFDMEIYYR